MTITTTPTRAKDHPAPPYEELAAGNESSLFAPGMHERFTDIAARRLATVAERIPVTVPDGGRFLVRPLLSSDRHSVASGFARQSHDYLWRRFFTPARPNSKMLDYLTDVDFVDHFAWAVLSGDGQSVVAQGRYIRRGDDRELADIAFDVFEEYQGRGMATMLLGALAVAASNAGIIRFVADVLYENHAMLAVLRKAHATWRHDQPGVVSASTDVSVAASLLDGVLRSAFARSAQPVITAAGLADAPPLAVGSSGERWD